ncbi:MAG TPA: hypothetical protein VJC16_00795 [Candidatus Nanoarchaeia archaeon]|nr:hypothetical protein [Candidatus Nanoarchaeia archaeon]
MPYPLEAIYFCMIAVFSITLFLGLRSSLRERNMHPFRRLLSLLSPLRHAAGESFFNRLSGLFRKEK